MKISVITVCYNSVETIERTIKSVISQDYEELEYIIIDGASTDGTLDIIEKYKDKIAIYISEPDHGLYDAMNKGLEKASGEVFAFLNSDDYYADNVLKKVNEYFENSNADMVSGNMYICENGINSKAVYDKSKKENMFFQVVYPHPALFAKKELYRKYGGFDTSYKIAADSEWVMRVCFHGADVLCVEDYFTYFSVGGLSSRKMYAAFEEQYYVALKYVEWDEYAYMEKRVQEFYSVELKEMKKREKCRDAFEKRMEDIKKLFRYDNGYYIWGVGNRGRECLQSFERLGLRIVGFIDSYAEIKEFNGYQVIRPEDIDITNLICITPKGYEKEIICELQNRGIEESRYFTYSNMVDSIILFAEEDDCGERRSCKCS